MKTLIFLLSLTLLSSTVLAKSFTNSYYIVTLQENVAMNQIDKLNNNGFDTQVDSTQPNIMYIKAQANAQVPFYLVNNIAQIQYVNAQGRISTLRSTTPPTQPNFFKIFFSFLI